MGKLMLVVALQLLSACLRAQGIYELWGMTQLGGSNDNGAIFKTDADGNNFQTVHDFNTAGAGAYPYGSLTFFNGRLYGMVSYGGPLNTGCFFEIDPLTGVFTPKLVREADVNGGPGNGSLVLYNDKFYGIGHGGTTAGVIFEWDPVTNIYIKKIDLTGLSGAAPGAASGSLTLVGNKFYGITANGGATGNGVLFEWDPATNIYTKRLDFTGLSDPYPSPYEGTLVEKDGILYGTGISGGSENLGVIFQWDIATHTYTKRFDFDDPVFNTVGSSPFGGLTVLGDKLYGTTMDGGMSALGLLYEWDPVTNIQTIKYHFDGSDNGRNPMCRLMAFGSKLYGMTSGGGLYDKGVLYVFDPATDIFEKKIDFDGTNAGYNNPGNMIVPSPVPVAAGVAGVCTDYPPVIIDNTNNNRWVPLVDNNGSAIAEIKANGNNLGTVSATLYVHNSTIREDQVKNLYLDRNISLTPQVQPVSPVDIRLYISAAEFENLRTSTNSNGAGSGINTINDLAIFKSNDGCETSLTTGALPLATSVEPWNGGYVLTTSINSFSSFYFANNANSVLPLKLISFTGKLIENNIELSWKTENEVNTAVFEIERSMDGRRFVSIGKVTAVNTAGVHIYGFTDFQPPGRDHLYFRLRQADINGRFTYSDVIVLENSISPVVLFYPNPVTGQAHLSVSGYNAQPIRLRIVDMAGRTVKQLLVSPGAGTSSINIDLADLPGGNYQAELTGKTINKQFSFIKR